MTSCNGCCFVGFICCLAFLISFQICMPSSNFANVAYNAVTYTSRQFTLCITLCYLLSRNVIVALVDRGFIYLARSLMDSSESDSSDNNSESLNLPEPNTWFDRPATSINNYEVSLWRQQEVNRSQQGRIEAMERRRQQFLESYEFSASQQPSIINTAESQLLHQWVHTRKLVLLWKVLQSVTAEATSIVPY